MHHQMYQPFTTSDTANHRSVFHGSQFHIYWVTFNRIKQILNGFKTSFVQLFLRKHDVSHPDELLQYSTSETKQNTSKHAKIEILLYLVYNVEAVKSSWHVFMCSTMYICVPVYVQLSGLPKYGVIEFVKIKNLQ